MAILFKPNVGETRLPVADGTASVLAQHAHSMPLLGHLEELRKRIILSVAGVLVGFLACWSYADRIFGLMHQPIIQALRRHGLGGGLVYLNPTEPFNLYLEVGLVAGLFAASPFVFYQLWLFIAPGLYRNEKRYMFSFLLSTVGLFTVGGLFGYRMVYPASLNFLIGYGQRFQPMITIGEYTKLFLTVIIGLGVIFEMPILVLFLALMHGSLDVAKSALFHARHFYCRRNRHTHCRHLEHVPFCCPDGRALCHQHRSGLSGESRARAQSTQRLTTENTLGGREDVTRALIWRSVPVRHPARDDKRKRAKAIQILRLRRAEIYSGVQTII
jgi:Tat protein translocase TatC